MNANPTIEEEFFNSEVIVPFVNDIKRCEEGMELFKIYKKRQHCSTRTFKLDLVQHRLVASTKDWRCIDKGAKYCNVKYYLNIIE